MSETPNRPSPPQTIPDQLPLLPLRNMVLFPGITSQLLVGRKKSLELVRQLGEDHPVVAIAAQRDAHVEEPGPGEIQQVGVAAQIHRVVRLPDGYVQIVVQTLTRVRLDGFSQEQPFLVAVVQQIEDVASGNQQELALAQNLSQQFQRVVALVPAMDEEMQVTAVNLDRRPGALADFVAAAMNLDVSEKQEILETVEVTPRLQRLTVMVSRELSVLEMGQRIQSQVRAEVGQAQREQYLREQMRIIQKELGEDADGEVNELREQVCKARLPAAVHQEAERELGRLAQMSSQAAEYTMVRTYLDWILALPWTRLSRQRVDLDRAERVLDEDHDGLDRIKERILEYVSVRKLKKDSRSPIFCFVGPPGVGKTSLGRSIARALGRKFVRVSLGGVRDESEIRGHRRTYVGALPGRVVQGLRKAGTANPVFMLDEIDKVGADFRGDPAAALLEVLDPEQNVSFVDHYLDLPFDLSKVTFIATANQLDTIPPALRDRMEVIQLSGYTEDEKKRIARNHLLPRQLAENGLARRKVEIEDQALERLIRGYTREAGVRNLERELGNVCRKLARRVVGGTRGPFRVTADWLPEMLGPEKVQEVGGERITVPGIAPGLAWTPFGGEVMFAEATQMRGGKGLNMTGKLGDVMRESAQIALSYIRARAPAWGIEPDFYDEHDIHIHLPSGAVPKDGPSAGVTVAVALLSLLTNHVVQEGLAMTGEITLRGRVLPVGGVKEKVLAANRAGYGRVILPRRNEPDLDELPENVRNEMRFVLVDHLDEVFSFCFSHAQVRRAA